MSFLQVDHVSKYFPNSCRRWTRLYLQRRDDQSRKGEFVTMIGHSGCGKSTLLNIIAGLETLSEGGVILNWAGGFRTWIGPDGGLPKFRAHALDDGVREHRTGRPIGLSGMEQ